MSPLSGIQVWQWYQEASSQGESAAAEWLLQATTDVDKLSLRLGTLVDRDTVACALPWPEFLDLWHQYLHHHVPLQYLVGITPWREWNIHVSPAVLIPRPETELIIDLVLQNCLPNAKVGHWLDLGTGSGAIAIGLAGTMPNSIIHAVDYSLEALAIAQKNIESTGFGDRVKLYQGSWWQPIQHLLGQVQGMVSNPPYIPSAMLGELQPEVVDHEPHLALDGGVDGLGAVRELVAHAPDFLVPGGLWVIEMMAGQGKAVVQLLEQQGQYCNIEVVNDWAGWDRFVLARRQ